MEQLRQYIPPTSVEEAAKRIIARTTVSDQHVERLRAELYMRPDHDPVILRAEIDAEIERQQLAASETQTQGY
jgi:hypothetical protein